MLCQISSCQVLTPAPAENLIHQIMLWSIQRNQLFLSECSVWVEVGGVSVGWSVSMNVLVGACVRVCVCTCGWVWVNVSINVCEWMFAWICGWRSVCMWMCVEYMCVGVHECVGVYGCESALVCVGVNVCVGVAMTTTASSGNAPITWRNIMIGDWGVY